ncbi:MAG: hypothetical protein AAGI01_14105 [Myxococcota bacterium]
MGAVPWPTDDVALVRDDPELTEHLGRWLDRGISEVVAQGSDAFLGRVLTTYHRKFSGHRTPLAVAPVGDGRPSPLVAHLGLEERPERAAKRIQRALHRARARRILIPTLRLTLSTSPHAMLGFDVGTGTVYALFSSARRGVGRAAQLGRAAVAMAKEVVPSGFPAPGRGGARLVIDGVPSQEATYTLASSLGRSWLGMFMGRGEALRIHHGSDPTQLFGQLATSQLPLVSSRSVAPATPFERVHLDAVEGVVLDGDLLTSSRPFIMHLSQGPRVVLLTP